MGDRTQPRLNAERDLLNKKREIHVQYLVGVYRQLALSANRPPDPKYFRDMEAAVADIQLLGTASQIGKIDTFCEEFSRQGWASIDSLLVDLRKDLREELQLEPLPDPPARRIQWFRPEGGAQPLAPRVR